MGWQLVCWKVGAREIRPGRVAREDVTALRLAEEAAGQQVELRLRWLSPSARAHREDNVHQHIHA